MIKTKSQRGFAPIIVLIMILLAGGVGAAVYMGSTKDNASQKKVQEDTEIGTTTEEIAAKTEAEIKTEAKPEAKAEVKIGARTTVAPADKVADASLIQNIQQGMDFGKEVLCTQSFDTTNTITEIRYVGTHKHFFSPRFPGIFSEEYKVQSTPDNRDDYFRIHNTIEKNIYGTATYGDYVTLPPGVTTRTLVGINSYSRCVNPQDFSKYPLPEGSICVEQVIADSYFIPDTVLFANEVPAQTVRCPGASTGKGS